MIPKTKLQKKIVKLSAKVSDVSEEDKRWAEEAIFDNHYVICRNRYNCLECGHKWNPEEYELEKYSLPTTCPDCDERNLNHVDHWDTDESRYEYWAIIDVIEGYQVVRMFFTEKYMKRKQPTQYIHNEVMQHWIREDGRITSMTMLASSMGIHNYYDSWSYGSDLEVRTNSRNHKLRQSIAPFKIRPGRNTIPIIRRNGYSGYFKGEAPHQFFSAILKYPKAETLLKADQDSLFKLCVGYEGGIHKNIEKYWDSICIAIRNDYIIEDANDWFDYLGMLDDLGKDLHNPHYVCPDNFEEAHNRYNDKLTELRKQQKLEKQKEKMAEENPKYVESKKPFFDLYFSKGDIEIIPLKSVKEFLIEGETHHHCLFNREYYKKDDYLHLSARMDGERLETIEIDLGRMEITHARGLQNKPTEHHDKIVDAVRENMDKIAKRNNQREVAA